jgi:two-component system OmpR family response regulator
MVERTGHGMRVLIVEDDRQLAGSLRRGLQEEGFGVDIVEDGDEAIGAALTTPFDVVVLDVMLPGRLDGFGVCSRLREQRVRTPVLMLTARDAVDDRVRGLEAGADDYLVKPFAFRELLARVRALSRRQLADRSSVLRSGTLSLDLSARRAAVGDRPLTLTAKEFAILEYFLHHPGQLLSRTQLEEHVWGYDFDSDSNLVEVYIARIRRKLAAAGLPDPIVTLRGEGYRLEPTPACAPSSAALASG